jgi:hypothetical protein
MKKLLITGSIALLVTNVLGQIGNPPPLATNPNMAVTNANAAWYRGGNNAIGTNPSDANIFGTRWQSNIYVMTNNRTIAEFTHDDQLTSLTNNSGDGLRIRNLNVLGSEGNLDMFTSNNFGQNETHIVWGGSGQVSGQNNRFEFLSKAGQGFWFDLINSNQYYKFATNATVHAFVGSNRFWRIGDQQEHSNISALRRLEVVQNDWQFRLSRTSGVFTDFQTNGLGNLQILPSGGNVGVNLNTNPTATLDVNGNARIRDVQTAVPDALFVGTVAGGPNDFNVRRLDFNGNAGQVLSGAGTWVTVNPNNLANNGVSINPFNDRIQLGDRYMAVAPTNTPLTVNRQVRLNGRNFVFSGQGRVAIGLTFPQQPTEVLDVNGNQRLRQVPGARRRIVDPWFAARRQCE